MKSEGDYPVKAMNARYLCQYCLPKQRSVADADALKPLIGTLDERCRTVEF